MTRVELNTDFWVAYFYHASKDAAASMLKCKMPDSLQHGIVAVIMAQCTLEGYINYMINKLSIAKHVVTIYEGKMQKQRNEMLKDLSVREKWAYLPAVVAEQSWAMNAYPFKMFCELVKNRNDLIHFNASKFAFTATSSTPIKHTDDLMRFVEDGRWLAGSNIEEIARLALVGHKIVTDMIVGLHTMLGSKPPDFLDSEKILYRIRIKK